jgi:hypothetical protein
LRLGAEVAGFDQLVGCSDDRTIGFVETVGSAPITSQRQCPISAVVSARRGIDTRKVVRVDHQPGRLDNLSGSPFPVFFAAVIIYRRLQSE